MTPEELSPSRAGADDKTENQTQLLLHFLRDTLDDRKLFSTPESRTSSIAEYCMSAELSPDDPLHLLDSFLPVPEKFREWYHTHSKQVSGLVFQDKHDKRTDRYDIEQEIVIYRDTPWLARFRKIDRLLPNKKEIQHAGIALQLLIYEAHWQAIDDNDHQQEIRRRQGEFVINGLINLVQ